MWYRFLLRCKGLVAPVLILAGCGGAMAPALQTTAPPGESPALSPVPRETEETVVLYFPHRSRPVLIRETRTVTRRGHQPEMLVLQELIKGPDSPDGAPVVDLNHIEAQVNLLGVKVFDGTLDLILTVQGAEALRRSGELAVFALVNSLAEVPRVGAVRFHIPGADGPFLVGSIDIREPVSPRPDLVEGN